MRENSVNKFYISIPNCHTGNELKLNVSELYSSIFQKDFGGGGKQKRAQLTPIDTN